MSRKQPSKECGNAKAEPKRPIKSIRCFRCGTREANKFDGLCGHCRFTTSTIFVVARRR